VQSRRKPHFFAHENAVTRTQPIAQQPVVVVILLTGIKENPGYDKEDRMSRKRTPDQKTTEASTTQTTAQDTSTAIAEPPAAANDNTQAANDNRPGFAERVGKRQWVSTADPYVIAADPVIGVRLYESKQDRQMAIKFGEKPSRAVLDRMHDAGWVWKQADRIWAHAVTPESAASTRIKAERLYQEVCKMIRQEIGAGQEVPF
jgi:hypothetical protein